MFCTCKKNGKRFYFYKSIGFDVSCRQSTPDMGGCPATHPEPVLGLHANTHPQITILAPFCKKGERHSHFLFTYGCISTSSTDGGSRLARIP